MKAKFEQVQAGAYFIVDIPSFQSMMTPYDPVVANQSILSAWDTSQIEGEQRSSLEAKERRQGTVIPPASVPKQS
jgi:hypothetical protein